MQVRDSMACLQKAMTGLALDMSDQPETTVVPKFLGTVETMRRCRLTTDTARS
jgi:hypothetical protein